MTTMNVKPHGVRRAYDRYRRLIGTVLSKQPPTACEKLGCSACCYFPVEVFEVEVPVLREAFFALPEGVRKQVIEPQAIRSLTALVGKGILGWPKADTRVAVSYAERYGKGLDTPCPLLDLETGRCRVYEARPMACRSCWQTGSKPCSDNTNIAPPEGSKEVMLAACIDLWGGRRRMKSHLLVNLVAEWVGGRPSVPVTEKAHSTAQRRQITENLKTVLRKFGIRSTKR